MGTIGMPDTNHSESLSLKYLIFGLSTGVLTAYNEKKSHGTMSMS